MTKTASKTMARARLATEGGWPSGFQEMKTRPDPNNRIDPNPLKKYSSIFRVRWVGGVGGAFLPYSVNLLFACSTDRPVATEVHRRVETSSRGRVCQSRSANSVESCKSARDIPEVRTHVPFAADGVAFLSSATCLSFDSATSKELANISGWESSRGTQ